MDQVRVLEIEALLDAAQLDVEVAADPFQRHLLAGVADGEVNLAEAAPANAALDRIPGQRLLPAAVCELHGFTPFTWLVPMPASTAPFAVSSRPPAGPCP